jgi:phosphate:Na+ symporter
MNTTLTLVDLAGAVALLLWGIHMVEAGVSQAFGSDLRRLLARLLADRFQAFAAGLGVTAVLQSSTATGLMIGALAADGLVAAVPALAVMLGANVGTTLIVQFLSFDVRALTPLLILGGVVLARTGGISRTRDLGRAAIGLGLMLTSLGGLLAIVTPFEDMPSLRVLMGGVADDRIVAMLFAAFATWLAHSSVAVVLVVMSFVTKGVVPFDAGLAMVIGANLGTALNPVLEGRGRPAGRRVALGNLIVRLAGAVVVIAALPAIGRVAVTIESDLARALADLHTLFNLVLAVVMLPLLGPFARLLAVWMPDRDLPQDPFAPIHLDVAALETPSLALGHAAREALRMSDLLVSMIQGLRRALDDGDRARIAEARRTDDGLDRLNAAIKTYLTRIDPDDLSTEERQRLDAILAYVVNLEHAGDILQRDVAASVSKYVDRGFALAPEADHEIREVFDRIDANARAAASVFLTENLEAARALAAEKEVFRTIEARVLAEHFERLRDRPKDARATSALQIDLLRDLKRIDDHLVAGAAYPVLENGGALMATRLRREVRRDAKG